MRWRRRLLQDLWQLTPGYPPPRLQISFACISFSYAMFSRYGLSGTNSYSFQVPIATYMRCIYTSTSLIGNMFRMERIRTRLSMYMHREGKFGTRGKTVYRSGDPEALNAAPAVIKSCEESPEP